jgi:SSS family solute:Na+ symporter
LRLQNLDQAFQFIQEFTGFVSPGALAIFLLGFFWKRATANGALLAAFGTFVFSLLLKAALPADAVSLTVCLLVFALCVLVMVASALIQKRQDSCGKHSGTLSLACLPRALGSK